MRLYSVLLITFLSLYFILSVREVSAQEDFSVWLIQLKQEAIATGISNKTVDSTIEHVVFMPDIIKLDLAQPEFISPFLDYYNQRVDAHKILRGRELLVEHSALLSQLQAQYGIPKSILVAFWGMETNYGTYQGDIDTFSALATLAYDGRRAEFFRSQLFDAMRMVDAGNASIGELHGSWAGAFGMMQFMPTTFMMYAVDGDGDGRIDIVNSIDDALASAANYLSQVGWHLDEPDMVEVQLPENFEWQNAQLNLRKSMDEWTQLGVKGIQEGRVVNSNGLALSRTWARKYKSKKRRSVLYESTYKSYKSKGRKSKVSPAIPKLTVQLPNTNSRAAILLPQGWRGPAFMVFENFDAIMDWNRSVNYALSVAQLAKCINQESPILGGKFAEMGALTFQQTLDLQALLNSHGFDVGVPDGFPGLNTQGAIRAYQKSQHLPADGYASPSLLSLLRKQED